MKPTFLSSVLFGLLLVYFRGPTGNRTRHTAVTGRRYSRLTTGPFLFSSLLPCGYTVTGCLSMQIYLKSNWFALDVHGSGLRGPDSNQRPSGYEPDELPLLYPAIFALSRKDSNLDSLDQNQMCCHYTTGQFSISNKSKNFR